jgi:phospholipase C
MENHDPAEIIGNDDDAPYINDALLPYYAQSSNFRDQFSLSVPSEPHYIWMEAGTNEFSDRTFTSNDSPSASNSTSDTNHLVTQLAAAGVSWMSYQEGMDSTSGACPVASSGHYHPRHNPFVFFQDVAGDPPSKTNAYCAAHHKNFDQLVDDLSAGDFARYNFITPDQCNDMHGHTGCPSSNLVRMGDDWLAAHMPALIDFVTDNAGVIFIVWDEGDATRSMPFIAVGPGVKAGYTGGVEYNHGSLVKSLQRIFDVDVTSRVSAEDDFSDLFEPGMFP